MRNGAATLGDRDPTLKCATIDDALYEIIDGVRREKVVGYHQAGLASILLEFLAAYVRQAKLGRVVVQVLVALREGLELRPDVCFVSYERWPRTKRLGHTNALSIVPDLTVEAVSLSNTADEVQEKLHEYLAAGVRQVWVIYPRQFEVYVYSSLTDVRIVTLREELDGGHVVPGFRLPLATLFEDDLVKEE